MGVPMNLLQNAIRKLGKKNILVVVLFFIVSGCLYALKKGSIRAALEPTLLGLGLFLLAALYLAVRSEDTGTQKKK